MIDKQGQGHYIDRRVDSETLWELINEPPATRADYLARYEFGYNYGPPAFPPQVFLEPTSFCNLRCAFCLYPDMQRPHQHTDMEMAKSVIDQCAEAGVWYFTIQFYGEPLLSHERVTAMINYAKEKGIPNVTVVSNMTLMNEKIMETWTRAGLDTLLISFDGSSPEKYQEIRNRDYHDVLERIKLARRVRDRLGLNRPFLGMTLVRTDETDEELIAFHREMSQYVDALDIRSMMLFHYRAPAIETYENQNPDWYVTRDPTRRIPCRQLGNKLIVCSNGEVTVCCTDIDAQLSLGNVRDKTLLEMWRSDEFGRLWMLHRLQRWDELPAICRQCRDWDWGGAQPDFDAADPRHRKES